MNCIPQESTIINLDLNFDSIRILTIGDPHFADDNAKETNVLHERIIAIIDEYKPDITVVLGDVQDKCQKISLTAQQRAIEFLSDIEDRCMLFCLVGNHDRINNADYLSKYSSLSFLHKWNNTILADRVTIVNISGTLIALVPYVPVNRFHEALNDALNRHDLMISDIKILFAHQELYGVIMNGKTGITSLSTDKWPDDYPLLVSGHIHKGMRVAENLLYTGSPLQHTFGEMEEKGVYIFDIADGIEQTYIPLSICPLVCLELNVEGINNQILTDDTSYKIKIKGTASEISLMSTSSTVKDWKKAGHVIEWIYTDVHGVAAVFKENNDSFLNMIKDKFKDNENIISIIDDYETSQVSSQIPQAPVRRINKL